MEGLEKDKLSVTLQKLYEDLYEYGITVKNFCSDTNNKLEGIKNELLEARKSISKES